jgi:hypothetical protein
MGKYIIVKWAGEMKEDEGFDDILKIPDSNKDYKWGDWYDHDVPFYMERELYKTNDWDKSESQYVGQHVKCKECGDEWFEHVRDPHARCDCGNIIRVWDDAEAQYIHYTNLKDGNVYLVFENGESKKVSKKYFDNLKS